MRATTARYCSTTRSSPSTLVGYIDATWGRDAIRDLLAVTTQAQLLARLGVTEQELLERWKAWVVR